jgi:DNA-binding response OmpR family regulator
MKILVVDDEKLLVKGIKFNLENEGYEVDACYDGETAVEKARTGEYDLILLDLMMPKLDGLGACLKIREFSGVPIIMLTAKGEDTDKIIGLEYGADDYVTKPFNILELKARIRALLRRAAVAGVPEKNQSRITRGHITIDTERRTAYKDDQPVELTVKEFDLAELLMRNPGKVYSRESLLDTVWGVYYQGDIRTVDVHIRRLREKLERNPAEPECFFTKWGVGYYFKD